MVWPLLHHRQGKSLVPIARPRLTKSPQSSSFLGPLVVGIIADSTGNIRYAFFFLFGMILAAVLPLLVVDVAQGHQDAESYSI